jgi:hypothetical protein
MSTVSQVPMIDKDGNPGMVPSDKVSSATAMGYQPAVKMIGPKGELGYVAQSKAEGAKLAGYTLHPDSMKPPEPNKSDDPGSSGQLATDEEVNARARATMANLSPAQKKALGISDQVQETAGNTMAVGGGAGMTAVAAPLVIPAAVAAAKSPAGQQVVKEGGKYVIKAAAAGLGWKLGGKWLMKLLD